MFQTCEIEFRGVVALASAQGDPLLRGIEAELARLESGFPADPADEAAWFARRAALCARIAATAARGWDGVAVKLRLMRRCWTDGEAAHDEALALGAIDDIERLAGRAAS